MDFYSIEARTIRNLSVIIWECTNQIEGGNSISVDDVNDNLTSGSFEALMEIIFGKRMDRLNYDSEVYSFTTQALSDEAISEEAHQRFKNGLFTLINHASTAMWKIASGLKKLD